MHEHRNPGGHMPPHERKALIHIEFDEADRALLKKFLAMKTLPRQLRKLSEKLRRRSGSLQYSL